VSNVRVTLPDGNRAGGLRLDVAICLPKHRCRRAVDNLEELGHGG
jgi:hypothetical protein